LVEKHHDPQSHEKLFMPEKLKLRKIAVHRIASITKFYFALDTQLGNL
jgi:hypothetical protein